MRFQDYIVEATLEAAKEAFKYAKAVPQDKVEWAPGEGARTVLSLCQELTMTPKWGIETIEGGSPEWNDEAMAAVQREMAQWKTIEECEAECNRRLEKLTAFYRSMPDERLSETRFLPYDGGRDFTFKEMMEYPRWNFTYHAGQIAYIQTLYGDKEMY